MGCPPGRLHRRQKSPRLLPRWRARKGRRPISDASLFASDLDGNGLHLLTPDNANHTASISPDNAYFVDSYSRVDLPGRLVLRRTKDGSNVRDLDRADVTELVKTGWKFPEPFQGKAGDGTTDLVRPDLAARRISMPRRNIRSSSRFTPGRRDSSFRKLSPAAHAPCNPMAEVGFVVVMVDGRGTTGRSRAFHEFSYHNLGGSFADHVDDDQADGREDILTWTSRASASTALRPEATAPRTRFSRFPISTKCACRFPAITIRGSTKPGGTRSIKAIPSVRITTSNRT